MFNFILAMAYLLTIFQGTPNEQFDPSCLGCIDCIDTILLFLVTYTRIPKVGNGKDSPSVLKGSLEGVHVTLVGFNDLYQRRLGCQGICLFRVWISSNTTNRFDTRCQSWISQDGLYHAAALMACSTQNGYNFRVGRCTCHFAMNEWMDGWIDGLASIVCNQMITNKTLCPVS